MKLTIETECNGKYCEKCAALDCYNEHCRAYNMLLKNYTGDRHWMYERCPRCIEQYGVEEVK